MFLSRVLTTFDHKREEKTPEKRIAEEKTIEAMTAGARSLQTPGFPGREKAAV